MTFGTIFEKAKNAEIANAESKTQMEKDFALIEHEGLFEEYLEMGINKK